MSNVNASWPPDAGRPRRVSDAVVHILAPNASFMTYEGTNTWILAESQADTCVVVDPGPDHHAHLDAVAGCVQASGWRVTQILLTHAHPDHADGARSLARLVGAPVRAFDTAVADSPLVDGEIVENGSQPITVLHTPGHSEDSASFWLPDDASILTGDTILGNHSAGVFGSLADFFSTLDRLRQVVERRPKSRLLPGHGPIVDDPVGMIDDVREAREKRLSQVRALLDAGVSSVEDVVDALYPHLQGHARFPAHGTVASYLAYLQREPVTEGDD